MNAVTVHRVHDGSKQNISCGQPKTSSVLEGTERLISLISASIEYSNKHHDFLFCFCVRY